MLRKSRQVAALLGISYYRLLAVLRSGKVDPLPEKDPSGDFIFTEADVERVGAALAVDRRRKPAPAETAAGEGRHG